MNKQDLIHKIKQLEGLSQIEKAHLIDLVNTKKKYGLVWEDKPEDVEELLRDNLPVLREVVERRILANAAEPALPKAAAQQTLALAEDEETSPLQAPPNHVLIEGDNLHALTALTFTHEGLIDVIYIDPPYNTGNRDFKYNDHFVDKEDSFRHSKWLSFMDKRLRIAKKLLSEKGVIFISIDDNEQAQLKLLCDEVFGQENFASQIAIINNLKGRSDEAFFATAHEYLAVYRRPDFQTLGVPAPDEYIDEYKLEDSSGVYRLLGLRKRGDNSKREDRPNLFYPIYFAPETNSWSVEPLENSIEIVPKLSTGEDGNWRWGKETLLRRENEILIQKVKKRNEYDVFQKDYLHKEDNQIKRIKPKSVWSGSEYSTDAGTKALKEIIPNADFRSPKPLGLIKHCLTQSTHSASKILDFFAGSGTALHATMQLNAEDGGNRQCILITNNENNICEEVTYERNKRVIQGYTNAKGVVVPGLNHNNLRYYKSGFVPSTKTEGNKRLLTQASTELLQIKENCYTDITETSGFMPLQCRIFNNEDGKYLIVVYHSRQLGAVCEELITYIQSLTKVTGLIKLYAFSPEKETLLEDFEAVADKIEAVPLPEAIYNAYRATFRTLKLDKKVAQERKLVLDDEVDGELFEVD